MIVHECAAPCSHPYSFSVDIGRPAARVGLSMRSRFPLKSTGGLSIRSRPQSQQHKQYTMHSPKPMLAYPPQRPARYMNTLGCHSTLSPVA